MTPHKISDYLHVGSLYLHLRACALAFTPMPPPCENEERNHGNHVEALYPLSALSPR